MGSSPRPAGFPRGAPGLLVLPPRGDHRAQRLGRLQPRAPGPAPPALLSTGPRGGNAHGGRRPRAPGNLLRQVQQPPRASQGGRDGRRERHLHGLRQHQPGRPARRWGRRLQRGLPPPAGGRRRDAPPAAQQQRADLAEDPRRVPAPRAPRRPEGLRIPLGLQRRRRGGGAAAPGQEPGGRAGRRLQRVRGGGRLREGGLHPHGLLQPAQDPRARPPRRAATRGPGSSSAPTRDLPRRCEPSTRSSRRSRDSCAISWT